MRKIFIVLILLSTFYFLSSIALAATNIDPVDKWAWNDVITWINFYDTNSVRVLPPMLTGYASSSIGDISLNCQSTRIGNICGASDYKVFNDGNGNLSGWGWNDIYGWISFCGGQDAGNCPGTIAYQVQIIGDVGYFRGWAWNDVVGWISFNCSNHGGCGIDYKVKTSWRAVSATGSLDSTIFDTGIQAGAQFNSILWQGSQPVGTTVSFQLAVSDSPAGPWNFIGFDGTDNSYYIIGPNSSLGLDYNLFNNKRYFRYRIYLVSDSAQAVSPSVRDIIINWSP